MVRLWLAACVFAILFSPARVRASGMDLALSRLHLAHDTPGCSLPASSAAIYCADNDAFERLISQLAVTVAPMAERGAATLGPRGFALSLSSTGTGIAADRFYWVYGTRGSGGSSDHNAAPETMPVWNRIEMRKGLPFGLEIGSSLGQGISTSMWLFSGELKWALFEGFHSGLGQLPDLAVRGVLQTMLGAGQLSLQTHAIDVTLSKPFVVAQRYRLTPFAALGLLFVRADTGRVDLAADGGVFNKCAPPAGGGTTECSTGSSAAVANTVVFNPISQNRYRVFFGLEGRVGFFTFGASGGFDLIPPTIEAKPVAGRTAAAMPRQFSFLLSLGLRY